MAAEHDEAAVFPDNQNFSSEEATSQASSPAEEDEQAAYLSPQEVEALLEAQETARHQVDMLVAARAPCDVFNPWVRWERGQVGI